MPPKRADQLRGLDREEDGLGVGRGREHADRLDIFLGDEIVDRLSAAALDRVADRLGRLGLRLGGALAGFGFAERGFRALGLRILPCFSPSARRISDGRAPSASRIEARFSRSAFICRVMALTMSAGGRMSFSSTRVIFTPQVSVA